MIPPPPFSKTKTIKKIPLNAPLQAGSEPVIIYNTKPPAGAPAPPGWDAAAAAAAERLQAALNPGGRLFSRQLALSSEGASTPLADFLQVRIGVWLGDEWKTPGPCRPSWRSVVREPPR